MWPPSSCICESSSPLSRWYGNSFPGEVRVRLSGFSQEIIVIYGGMQVAIMLFADFRGKAIIIARPMTRCNLLVAALPRAAVVRRLVALEGEGRLGSEQVQLATGALKVSARTVWRLVRQARAGEGLDRRPRERFQVTDEIRQRVAFWRGNTAAVHRELTAAAKVGGPPAPKSPRPDS
jgi:hypothetical protein